MAISPAAVKELREKSGAGMMDCKRALSASNGDMSAALDALRKQGIASAEKRGSREAKEGLVESYIHPGNRVGVLIEVNSETDFVARTDEFGQLVRDLAMQVAAAAPLAVRREDLDQTVIEKEREIFRAQVAESGKPANIIDKIVDGRIEKYFSDVCLLDQAFIKDPSMTVGEMVKAAGGKMGENIVVRRFTRFALGQA